MRRGVAELAILSLLALLACVAGNFLRGDRVPLRLPVAYYQVESGAKPALLHQVRRLFEAGETVFVDARPADEYEAGQIQGAFSLPFDEWREILPRLAPWIENQPLVIYSSDTEVSLADDLAGALIGKGHAGQIHVFVGSLDDWRDAGLPIRTGPDPVLSAPAEDDSLEVW